MNRIAIWTRKRIAQDLEGIQQGLPYLRTVLESKMSPRLEVLLNKSLGHQRVKNGTSRDVAVWNPAQTNT